MSDLDDILTERLVLRLLPPAGLAATISGNAAELSRLIRADVPQAWFMIGKLAQMRLGQLHADPDYLPWSLRAIILRKTGEIAGYANFHAKPEPELLAGAARDGIELGYTILEPFRRRGLARETVLALLGWAAARGAGHAVLSISPGNVASLGLARQLGFVKVGSQIDEEDGPEDIYLVSL